MAIKSANVAARVEPDIKERKVTEHAEEAMRSISMYIAFKLINPKAAFDLLDLFQKEIESLETMPERVKFIRRSKTGSPILYPTRRKATTLLSLR